jgi:predicted  nucleic acid-binding Zn-ribbon protein
MKTRAGIAALIAMVVFGCNNQSDELKKQVGQLQSDKAALQQSIADRDKYFEEVIQAVNDVYADLEKARVKEAQLVERAGSAETPAQVTNADTRQKLLSNITAVGSSLKENRKKISDLQIKLRATHKQYAALNEMVEGLKQKLQEREQSIAMLEARVQGLEETVLQKTALVTEKEAIIENQAKQMGTAYYVVGTRDELKEKGVIKDEGGFLWGLIGSTTIMNSPFDPSLFTPIDRTKDQVIRVKGKIDEILPQRNRELFALKSPDESRSDLMIVRPDKFWQQSYLVIIVD